MFERRCACPDLETLTRGLEAPAESLEARELFRHAEHCPACARQLQAHRSLEELGRELPAAELSPAFSQRFRRRLQRGLENREEDRRARHRARRRATLWTGVALYGFLVVQVSRVILERLPWSSLALPPQLPVYLAAVLVALTPLALLIPGGTRGLIRR